MMGTERADYEAWKEWSEGDFGKFSFHQDAYYRAEVFDRCSAVPGTKLLEIGYGNGSPLEFSSSLGSGSSLPRCRRPQRDGACAGLAEHQVPH